MRENKIIKFVQLNKCVINTTRSFVRFISFYFTSFMGVKGRCVHLSNHKNPEILAFILILLNFKPLNNSEIHLI